MSKPRLEPDYTDVLQMTQLLDEGDDALDAFEIQGELRRLGVDPEELKLRFHRAAERLAERERKQGRAIPPALEQAITATARLGRTVPRPTADHASAKEWIASLRSRFRLPTDLEAVRAYRKTVQLSKKDQDYLDKLEANLKEEVKRDRADEQKS